MSGKFALIIGNTEYTDPGLAQLTAPGKDTEDFARVLKDREIGAFDDVNILLNQPESVVRGVIDEFFDQKKPDDLLVLYFSGHGVRDELGALFLAVKNTIRSRLRSTAVKSDYIREVMDQSRSKRQVLILDCCMSGAFSQGTKAATGVSIGTASAFEGGYGRIILTASDSTQFAWEGDKVIGNTNNSLFTHYLVEGLEGEADLDGDGRITVDELYDYAYEKVKLATPKQTPSKFSSKQQGEIVLRQNMPMEEIKSVPLPQALLDSIENPFSDVRMGAVQQLIKLLKGKNLGLARSAREALEQIAEKDDSRQVIHAARQALESARQTEEAEKPTQSEEPEKITREAQRIIHERAAESERLEKEKAERFAAQKIDAREELSKPVMEKTTASIPNQQAVLWITLGWMISGLFAGYLWSEFDDARGEVIAGIIGGGGGGFITAFILRSEKILSDQISMFRIVLAWAIGGAIGWLIGWGFLSEASGAGIGIAIFALIGLATTLGMDYVRSNWLSIASLTATWWFGGAIGWSISKGLIDKLGADPATSWAIGTAIGWSIAGFILGRQLLNNKSEKKK